VNEILNNIYFVFQRFDWFSALDILLVTIVFFGLLYLIRDTQAMVLLRGIIFVIVLTALLTTIIDLPAFSWLLRTSFPALLLAIPVIFSPEIRRGLERIGRILPSRESRVTSNEMLSTIQAVVSAASRLSARQHGALIVLQRIENLADYVRTGVTLQARVTPELLLQIFYPNTPLHDGAAIIEGNQILAAACVLPLSASGILVRSPDRQMGLRHRAALGISEDTDAIAVVVSEESGFISIAHGGRMIRRLDPERLENILIAFLRPEAESRSFLKRSFPFLKRDK
jgi:diadenylate cyclase